MATPTIPNGEEHFFPILYEGNGAGQRVGKFVPFTDSGTIANSVIFNRADSPRLARTPSSAGNRKTWTFSAWIKRTLIGSPRNQILTQTPSNGASGDVLNFHTDNTIKFTDATSSYYNLITNRTFEDTSKWYHILLAVDTTQATASNRVKLYVDGEQITSFSTETYPSQDFQYTINNSGTPMNVYSDYGSSSAEFSDGYIAEVNIVDGQALAPASFGVTDTSTGRWIPSVVKPYPTTTTTFTVTVSNPGSGNKYYIDSSQQATVTLIEGATYRFDQSDSSNSGHPLRFSTTSDGTHGGGSEFTSGVTTVGTPGSSGAYTEITVPTGTATLYYYCTNHSGMGGTANTQDQYGTNGFRLQFQDSSSLGDDTSGNTNDFTATNLASTDQTTDSPTQNFATIDVNTASNGSMTFAEGNLNVEMNNAYPGNVLGTLGASSGKYYWEVTISGTGSSANGYATGVGVAEWSKLNSDPGAVSTPFSSFIDSRSSFVHNGGTVSNSTTFTAGDVISIALNLDDSEISYFKNNTIVGSAQPLVEGQTYFPLFKNSTTVADLRYTPNFGQKSWNYTPPTGFVALQQDNLPETSKGISGFVWVKNRDSASYNHVLYDSSRGVHKYLNSNTDSAQGTDSDGLTKFLKGGFATEDAGYTNTSGNSFVSWNWVANGGTTSSNTDGSITSTVQANTTAGFSIVQYTGTASNGSVGHGLSQAPEWIMVRILNVGSVAGFTVSTTADPSGFNNFLYLNETEVSRAYDNWQNTAPTNSVFTLSSSNVTNYSGQAMLAYCWHSVEGYSKFGRYTGNGSTDGPFVYTGFKPAFLMIKSSSHAVSWYMFDNKRNPSNPAGKRLVADGTYVEDAGTTEAFDFLSNGFKLKNTSAGTNGSGYTYIYMAFAEHPFVGDGTSPVTAR